MTYRRLTQNIHLWLTPLVVLAVLALSAILPVANMLVLDNTVLVPAAIIGLIIGTGLLVAFWNWPSLGLVAMVPASLVVALAVGTGSEYSTLHAAFLLLMLLLGLWVAKMLLKRELRLVWSRPVLPLLAFILVDLFSFAFGQLPWYFFPGAPVRAQLGGLIIVPLSVGAFVLVAQQIRDIRWLEAMTWVFLALGTVFILGRLYPSFGWRLYDAVRQPGVNGEMTYGFFQPGTDGSLTYMLIVALAFSQAVFNRRLNLLVRGALVGLVMMTLYYTLIEERGWVSGWLPPLVAIVAILWAGAPRFGMAATLVGAAGILVKLQSVISKVMIGDNSYSLSTRLDAWKIVWDITKISPIFGLGPSNYYGYSERFGIRGYNVKFVSHNNFVDIVAQYGLLGLGCFLWFAGEFAWLGWKLRSRVPRGFARAYVIGSVGMIAGTMAAAALGDWVLPFVYNIGFTGFRSSVLGWLFLGGLVAIEKIYLDHPPEPAE